MAEHENIVIEEPKKKLTWAKFKAGIKEWFRKQIVNLKRRPTNIALFILAITSLIYLIGYSNIAQFLYSEQRNTSVLVWSGLCSFITFLFSILVFLLFMNAFPKRKKTNIAMLVLTYLFLAIMIFTNIVCYLENATVLSDTADTSTLAPYYFSARNLYVVHIVFLCITIVVLSLTPLIKMGLMKINTRKEVESTVSEMHGELDLEETI